MNSKKFLTAAVGAMMSFSTISAAGVSAAAVDERTEAVIYATVTDAGQYIDKMEVEFPDAKSVAGVDNETFEVYMTSTVTYGALEGQPYPYFDASKPLEVVKTEVDGNKVTVYFNQAGAPTLTWLGEGRNMPAKLSFTITQTKPVTVTTVDGRELETTETFYSTAESYKDLVDEEVSLFEDVQDEINYQLYTGSNDTLIVWFHGNGEGDFSSADFTETKLTNNNVAQILANRGGVAWVTPEAQEVFGDATVMAFQSPSVWYRATADGFLEACYNEIQEVIAANGINPENVYVSGCSAGGFMTTRMIIAYPDLFKAAMINCPALDIANLRSGLEDAIPTDEELATLKQSKTAIWLVQGETDSSVNPEDCSKRIWNILTEGVQVSENTYEGTAGIASGFTTYETLDNKYKLSLYETVDQAEGTGTLGDTRLMGKIVCAEDYNQDGELEAVKYNDHWSWVYTLRNNPEDKAGEHIWQWAANYTELPSVGGTAVVEVWGDDWGPAVDKVVMTLEASIKAESLDPANWSVQEVKEAPNWAAGGVPMEVSAYRTVVDAYLSDEEGNPSEDSSGNIVTLELYTSPNEGSPFFYELGTGFNRWVDLYKLSINGVVEADGETALADVQQSINFYNNDEWFSPLADQFAQKVFTPSSGRDLLYGEYVPAAKKAAGGEKALVIWLHGAGEGTNHGKNDNYIDLLGNEVTALITPEFQDLFGGAYVVTPQAETMWMDDGTGAYQSTGNSMYHDDLFEFIEDYVKNHSDISPDRVIIGGCSNGGYMTMEMILKHPGYFYKAYPICEAYTDSAISDAEIKALAESRTQVWFTFADADTTVDPTATSIPTYERLKAAGGDVHKTQWEVVEDITGRFEGHVYAGHWSWIYFDNNANTCDDCGKNEWVWLAEWPAPAEEEPKPETPGTGDSFNAGVFGGLAFAGLAAAGAAWYVLKKKKDEE